MNQPVIRILVVDDESAIRRALRPPLVELGFQVVEASRGEEALLTLRASAFDVVLLDINMPVMNGWDFLTAYRQLPEEQKSQSKIVMLTTSMNPDDELRAKTFSEIKEFNFKPLDKAMMLDLLQKHFPELM